MRKPSKILLVLLSASAISACDSAAQKRNVYTSRERCLADYNEAQCEPDKTQGGGYGGGSGGGGGRYYGPWYNGYSSSGSDPGPGRTGTASSTISRGGFGSMARGFGGAE